jgi:hypothetical protein
MRMATVKLRPHTEVERERRVNKTRAEQMPAGAHALRLALRNRPVPDRRILRERGRRIRAVRRRRDAMWCVGALTTGVQPLHNAEWFMP